MRRWCLASLLLCLAGPLLAGQPAPGQLLVASRDMPDARFAGTVILLVSHDADGSVGLVVNRPSRLSLAETVPDLAVLDLHGRQLFFGGPVDTARVAMLLHHDEAPAQTLEVIDQLHFGPYTAGMQQALADGHEPSRLRFYHGYAGWGPGQLQGELAAGGWHLQAGSVAAVLSADPLRLWQKLIEHLDPAGLTAALEPPLQ